jgi:hypothetical protein
MEKSKTDSIRTHLIFGDRSLRVTASCHSQIALLYAISVIRGTKVILPSKRPCNILAITSYQQKVLQDDTKF